MNITRRLFIGIPLSPPFRKRLSREIHQWPKEAVLPTAEENLHVTLLFLGFVQEDQVPSICAKVGEACKNFESFELFFTGIKLLDNDEHPKMIWLTGEASEELKNLREAMEKKFSAFITEKKSYRPHVTLAKIKKQKWLSLSEKPKFKEQTSFVEPVDTVCIFESLSLDGKRRYEPIDTFALQ
ncbi:MAG: RNA 2',3'-cyclic phosphodiesterase [Candidatus Moranbacteria bacterium]|nr:RNA 2',3'-cyclic phosphodiesterase [Candidatus Moranbacteria bacterium]